MILMKLSTEQQISSLAGFSWDRRKVVSCSNTFSSSVSTMSLVARVCTSWLEDRILVASG